jgi:hypothetical protein
MTFRTFQQLTEPKIIEGLKEVDRLLTELRALKRQDVKAVKDGEVTPKMCWKIECYLQGIVYRTIALCEAGKCCWNASNLLGATIMGRAVIETAAISFRFCREVERGVHSKDVAVIDGAVMKLTFAARHRSLNDIMPEAPNILSSIDQLDRFLCDDKQTQNVRNVYEFLCEFAHPNWVGTVGLFGQIDKEECTQYFSDEQVIVDRVAAYVVMGLGAVSVVHLCHKQVTELLPELAEITPTKLAT